MSEREEIARAWHESYFAHPWEQEDAAGRACALQAADAILAWIETKRLFASPGTRVEFYPTTLASPAEWLDRIAGTEPQ